MNKHILKENYVRFFGSNSLEESDPMAGRGSGLDPSYLELLTKALEKVGFTVSEPRPYQGTIEKDPQDIAFTIDFEGIERWNDGDKRKVLQVVELIKKQYPIRVAFLRNGMPQLGRKALVAFVCSEGNTAAQAPIKEEDTVGPIKTVSDLINQLQQFDPNLKISWGCSIETGRSLSISNDCEVEIEEDGGSLLISLSGEETDYQ